MRIDLDTFKPAYEKWVEESLPDYQAGNVKEIVKKYPLIVSEDVPWTAYTGSPSEQTFALVTSGGLYLKDRQPPFDTVSIHGDPILSRNPQDRPARTSSALPTPIMITAWRSRTST